MYLEKTKREFSTCLKETCLNSYFQQSACSRPLMGSLVDCRTPSLFHTRTFLAPVWGQTALTANSWPSPRHVTRGLRSSHPPAGCTSCVASLHHSEYCFILCSNSETVVEPWPGSSSVLPVSPLSRGTASPSFPNPLWWTFLQNTTTYTRIRDLYKHCSVILQECWSQ